jgi:hypothetical protein
MSTPNPATTPWVPVWNLNGGMDIRYNGDWASGSYSDGDVVVYNGILYLCVKSTNSPPDPSAWPTALPTVANGMWLKGVGGAAVWSAITPADVSLIPYGTSLPASPFSGQEAILVDSTSNPSYQWRFRWNAGSSSAYKWEFIGGTPATDYVDTAEAITAGVGGYGDVATVGPTFTAPRSGEYDVSISTWVSVGAANNWVGASTVLYINAVGNWTNPIIQSFTPVYPTGGIQYFAQALATGRCAIGIGNVLRPAYGVWSQSGTGMPNVGRRRLYVYPARVS